MVLHDLLLLIEAGDSWFLRLCFYYGLLMIFAELFLPVFLNARLRYPTWCFNLKKIHFPVLSHEEFLQQKRQLEREIHVLQKEITSSTMLKKKEKQSTTSYKKDPIVFKGGGTTGMNKTKTTQQSILPVSKVSTRVDSDRFRSKKTSSSNKFVEKQCEMEDFVKHHHVPKRKQDVLGDERHYHKGRRHIDSRFNTFTHSGPSSPPSTLPVHVPSAVQGSTFQHEDFRSRLSSNEYDRTTMDRKKITLTSSNRETATVRGSVYQIPRPSDTRMSQTFEKKTASIPTKLSLLNSQHHLSGTKRKWDEYKSQRLLLPARKRRPLRTGTFLVSDQYKNSGSTKSSEEEEEEKIKNPW